MPFLARLYRGADSLVSHVGYLAGWLMYPLIAITVFDVVSRRFFVLGSTYLQEAEWHLHTVVVMMALGYTYLRNRHVRIDIFRSRWSPRTQAWIELVGCLVFLAPFTLILVYYGYRYSLQSWMQHEVSSSGMGLTNRWAIKAFVPFGAAFLLAGGLGVLIRTCLFLWGPPNLRSAMEDRAAAAADPNFR